MLTEICSRNGSMRPPHLYLTTINGWGKSTVLNAQRTRHPPVTYPKRLRLMALDPAKFCYVDGGDLFGPVYRQ